MELGSHLRVTVFALFYPTLLLQPIDSVLLSKQRARVCLEALRH